MSEKSSRLGEEDFRAVYRLIGECRELGDDPVIWLQHFYAGLARLIGADVVMGGEMGGVPFGPMRTLGVTDWGFDLNRGFDRKGWLAALAWFDADPLAHPVFRSVIEQLHHRSSVTMPRQQLLEDRLWYPSRAFNEVNRLMGTDAVIESFLPIAETSDGKNRDMSGIVICRALGRRQFQDREVRLASFLHEEITPLIGRSLARFEEPSASMLAPRVRQVLRCLLEGDGDKQIAVRLNLSPHTVNQYLKTIYRHFGVSSRAELLARWIRRGWGARCAWTKTQSV